ncbi:MAG: hypothetical protein AAFX81_13250 [Pseudomonadota bacterium]
MADQTAAATAESGQNDAQALLTRLSAEVSDPLLVLDRGLWVLAANQSFADATGWSTEDCVGQPLTVLFGQSVGSRLARDGWRDWSIDPVWPNGPDGAIGPPAQFRAAPIRLAGGIACWLVRLTPWSSREPGHGAASHTADSAAAETALVRLVDEVRRSGGRLGGAHVRLIGLAKARERAGDAWPKMQRRIGLVCEQTILGELGESEVFTTTAAGDFVVCFACADHDEADRRAARLQARIDRRLLGERAEAATDADAAWSAVGARVASIALPAQAMGGDGPIAERIAAEAEAAVGSLDAEFDRRLAALMDTDTLTFHPIATRAGAPTTLVRARWEQDAVREVLELAVRSRRLEEALLALDRHRLRLVGATLGQRAEARRPVLLDLGFATAERRVGQDMLRTELGPIVDVTKRWLVPNLTSLPLQAYHGSIYDALVAIRPLTRTQALAMPPHEILTIGADILPCRLFVLPRAAAEAAARGSVGRRLADHARYGRARLVLDGSADPDLAAAVGAELFVA